MLQPHEVAAVAAVGPGGAPAFVLQVRPAFVSASPVRRVFLEALQEAAWQAAAAVAALLAP